MNTINSWEGHQNPPLTRADVETMLHQVGRSEKLVLRALNLSRVDLKNLRLHGVDLSEANLNGANLNGADLSGASLYNAQLIGAHLNNANLNGADLSGANLSGAGLYKAQLIETRFIGADLRRADLREADLRRADLREADLDGAYLGKANLDGVHLSNVHLNEVDLSETNLTQIVRVSLADISKGQNVDLETVSAFRLRLVEEPLTPSTLLSVLFAITELATKCWLIAQRRFDDLIQYTQTHDAKFVEESQLHFTRITYNSPFDASFHLDLSASNVAEGIVTALDGIVQVKQKLRRAEIDNEAKIQEIAETKQKAEREEKAALIELDRQALVVERERLDLLEKQLNLQKKAIEYALEIAARTVAVLRPDADEQVKGMLIQTLLPTLLRAHNIDGLELILPPNPNNENLQIGSSKIGSSVSDNAGSSEFSIGAEVSRPSLPEPTDS